MMDGEAFLAVTAALRLVDWGIWHCKSRMMKMNTNVFG